MSERRVNHPLHIAGRLFENFTENVHFSSKAIEKLFFSRLQNEKKIKINKCVGFRFYFVYILPFSLSLVGVNLVEVVYDRYHTNGLCSGFVHCSAFA